MPEHEPDWDTVMEQRAEAERDWFATAPAGPYAAWCDGELIDRDTKVPCQLPPDHPGHPHEGEFFGAIYRWDTSDGDYQVAAILADEWETVHRA